MNKERQSRRYGRVVIIDNATGNSLAARWVQSIRPPDALSIVSAYFTMQAYSRMSKQLDGASSVRFMFGDPSHVDAVDAEALKRRTYEITEEGLASVVQLKKRPLAQRFERWLDKPEADIRTVNGRLLRGKMRW